MGKSRDKKKHKKDKKDKDKRDKRDKKDKDKKDKKRRIEYSSSDSEREIKRSKYDDSPQRQEKKEKRKKRKSRDYSSSSSSSSSSEDEKEKRKRRKEPILNTDLLGTTIAIKNYESVRNKFRAWLEQDEKIDTPLESIESKTDLLMLHFGKFSQLWNEGKLDGKYYHKVEDETKQSSYTAPSGVVRGPSVETTSEETKFTVKGDNSLSDRYLLGSREVPWIQKRVSQMKKSKEKRMNRLSAKAEAYQEQENAKMDEFKRIMGLS